MSACLALLPFGTARGDEAPSVGPTLNWVRLSGADECEDAVAMAARIETRLGQPLFVRAPDAIVVVEGVVERTGSGGYRARLRLSAPDGTDFGTREIAIPAGQPCEQLAALSALVISVSLRGEGGASGIPLPADLAAMLDALFEDAPSDPDMIPIEPGPAAEPVPQVRKEVAKEEVEKESDQDPPPRRPIHGGPSLSLSAASGLEPRGALGVTVELELAIEGLFSLVATSTAGLPITEPAQDSDGRLRISSWRGWLALCLPERPLGPSQLSLCLAGGAGRLRVRARDFQQQNGTSRLWFGQLGPQARVRIPLPHQLYAALALLVPVRLTTPTAEYLAEDGIPVQAFQVKRVGVAGSLGLGWRAW